jgi:hypothetical protein
LCRVSEKIGFPNCEVRNQNVHLGATRRAVVQEISIGGTVGQPQIRDSFTDQIQQQFVPVGVEGQAG